MAEQHPNLGAGKGTAPVHESAGTSFSPAVLPERGEGETPMLAHERPANTRIPVTPGIALFTYRAQHSPAINDDAGAPSYFTRNPTKQERRPETETSWSTQDLLKGAMTSQEVLRRMSLSIRGRRESLTEIKNAAPDLSLSGNVISATFVTPHHIKYRKGGEWELRYRHGQSALFDSFSYLSSDQSPWNHSAVAWTGEIEALADPLSPPETPPNTTTSIPATSSLSAPVPLPGAAPSTEPAVEGLWIPREHKEKLEYQLSHDERIKTIPVWLADSDDKNKDGIRLKDQRRWRRYAEHQLYTLFHYKQNEPSNGQSERKEWADYYRVNLRFAEKILQIYKPGDIVVVHDYYLMLLPSMLRQKVPNIYIAFYLHCPFPSSEFLRCLPRRKEVLEGVLGANLVGFQSYSYSRHFASCCTRVLDFPSDATGVDAYGVRVEVGVFPIGINAGKVGQLAWSPEVTKKYAALKELYKGKKVIVGRDRLDSVRGVAQKLMAFERFLELYPEWRDKVILIQVTSPTSIEEEKEDPKSKVASRVNELVTKINGAYGSLESVPVQHFPQYLAPDEYFALLRAADIGLITSVRDGMNTTSLEYVVCQRENAGPLILSEFSGTAGSLRDAIHINPWDLTDVAHQINIALTMPEEMRTSMQEHLYQHVTTQNFQSWITKFLRKLVGTLASTKDNNVTPLLDRTLLLSQYRAANKRLFMFDYDGTLTPIVREPSAAIPSERVIQTLKALASDKRNAVWIISGRDQDFLQQHLGHIPELGFSAEHGSFIRPPGESDWVNLAEKLDMGWQREVIKIFQESTDKIPGSFIERKRCAVTWHYRQAEDQQGGLKESEKAHKAIESSVTKKWDVDVMKGKANLEVRPTFINKGEIAKRLVDEYSSTDNPDPNTTGAGKSRLSQDEQTRDSKLGFVLCLGDDFTDEDMFRALNNLSGEQVKRDQIFTVTVGSSNKLTLAKWHLLEPEDVVEIAGLLAGVGLSGEPGEQLSQVNLAAVAGLEDHLPE
ncbi:hypothetical protein DL763_003369 [Monosporascus cannonballus]|nr:hypothetical protein DL763_003369 [Monosporascus cannonballus]